MLSDPCQQEFRRCGRGPSALIFAGNAGKRLASQHSQSILGSRPALHSLLKPTPPPSASRWHMVPSAYSSHVSSSRMNTKHLRRYSFSSLSVCKSWNDCFYVLLYMTFSTICSHWPPYCFEKRAKGNLLRLLLSNRNPSLRSYCQTHPQLEETHLFFTRSWI